MTLYLCMNTLYSNSPLAAVKCRELRDTLQGLLCCGQLSKQERQRALRLNTHATPRVLYVPAIAFAHS